MRVWSVIIGRRRAHAGGPGAGGRETRALPLQCKEGAVSAAPELSRKCSGAAPGGVAV